MGPPFFPGSGMAIGNWSEPCFFMIFVAACPPSLKLHVIHRRLKDEELSSQHSSWAQHEAAQQAQTRSISIINRAVEEMCIVQMCVLIATNPGK